MWAVHSGGKVQKVELVASAIIGTDYEADASSDKGGNDSQTSGIHAYQLKMHANYVANSTTDGTVHHSKVNVEPFKNDKRIFDTMGALQIVPDNMWLDPTFATVTNPYTPVIYIQDKDGNAAGTLGPTHAIDWFFDPFSGIIFLQDFHEDVIPYKVECFIYVGNMADQTTGGATTLNGLTDVNAGSPTNGHALVYNSSSSKWEPQAQSGGGGIQRFEYEQTTGSVAANTAITFTSGTGFNGATPTLADTQVYLNGQLLLGGSQTDLNAGDVDYHLVNDTQIKLLHATTVGDIIAIFHTTTSFSTGKDILLHTDDAAFDSARVITAGDGISISVATSRQLTINNSGLIQRTKENFLVSSFSESAIGGGNPNNKYGITFSGSYNFGTTGVNYSDHRIDVFINGVLKEKGYHYNLQQDSTGGTLNSTEFEWVDSIGSLSGTDRVTIIIF